MRLSTDELMQLAPRLRAYLKTPNPAWPEIVDAADWLRARTRGVEIPLGRGLPGHGPREGGDRDWRSSRLNRRSISARRPGGYFHGMVAKAKTGEAESRPHGLGAAQRAVNSGGAERRRGAGRRPGRGLICHDNVWQLWYPSPNKETRMPSGRTSHDKTRSSAVARGEADADGGGPCGRTARSASSCWRARWSAPSRRCWSGNGSRLDAVRWAAFMRGAGRAAA